jgi:HEXXH motif-containing protein
MTNGHSAELFDADLTRRLEQRYKRTLLMAFANRLESASRSAAFASLASLRAAEIMQRASPFFWLAILRLVSDEQQDPRLIEEAELMTLDCFLDVLESPCTVTISAGRETDIVFPVLNVVVPAGLNVVAFERVGPQTLAVLSPDSKTTVVDLTSQHAPLPSPFFRATAGNPPIFQHVPGSQALIDDISDRLESHRGAEELSEMVGQAMGYLASAAPTLHSQISSGQVPLVAVKERDASTQHSFTVFDLPWVIFLSKAANTLLVAEALVHENYHTLFNLYERIVENQPGSGSDNRLYYSPWRTDARPIRGLLHAIVTFSGVAAFYRQIVSNVPDARSREVAEGRLCILRYQLQIATAQLSESELSRLPPGCLAAALEHREPLDGVQPNESVLAVLGPHFRLFHAANPAIALPVAERISWLGALVPA